MKRIRAKDVAKRKPKHRYGVKDDRGAPPFVPTLEQRNFVAMSAAATATKEEIAACVIKADGTVGISIDTLDKYFHDELQHGYARIRLRTNNKLIRKAHGFDGWFDEKRKKWIIKPTEPDLGALIWLEKTRFGVKDNQVVTHQNPDGSAISQPPVIVILPSNGRDEIEGEAMQVIGEGNGRLPARALEPVGAKANGKANGHG